MLRFGTILKPDCVNIPPPPDERCSDPAFANANPNICPVQPKLIIKPGIALVCLLGSIQFKVFYVKNGVETDVTADAVFSTSDPNTCVIGAGSGNATGIQAGEVSVTATYQEFTATADLTVIGSSNCCENETVAFQIVIDTSKSMSQGFNSTYPSKLEFAKFAAKAFIDSIDSSKDITGAISFNDFDLTVLDDPTSNVTKVKTDITAIAQTTQSTSFFAALQAAVASLNASGASSKVLLLISDGEDQKTSYATENPIAVAESFKQSGGAIICLGTRASGPGYELLNALCTGGFFINSYNGVQADAVNFIIGLKGYICGGNCTPEGDNFVATGELNYTDWEKWTGQSDLLGNGFIDLLPGNGLYVDLSSATAPFNAPLETTNYIPVTGGKTYRISLALAGNQRLDIPSNVTILIKSGTVTYLNQILSITDYAQDFQNYSFTFTPPTDDLIKITVSGTSSTTTSIAGPLLDKVSFDNVTDGSNVFADDFDSENLQYVPPRCGTGTTPIPVGEPTLENLVPTMTDYNAPSGIASASSEIDPLYPAWRAFDHQVPTLSVPVGEWICADGEVPCWLKYQFPVAKRVLAYRITAIASYYQDDFSGDSVYWPVDFYLEGSNNGTDWTLLDNQVGMDFTLPNNIQTFTIASPDSYLYYRLTSTRSTDGGFQGIIGVGELELLGNTGETMFATGYACYSSGCLNSNPPPAQLQDPNPLPDIEAGFIPPKTYKSTKNACAHCPSGFINVDDSTVGLIPTMTSNTTPSGVASASSQDSDRPPFNAFDGFAATAWVVNPSLTGINEWLQYQFDEQKTVLSYAISVVGDGNAGTITAFRIQGSNDGSNWTTIDTRNAGAGFTSLLTTFDVQIVALFSYFRIIIDARKGTTSGLVPAILTLQLYGVGDAIADPCADGSGQSQISQADADAKALANAAAAATLLLNCVQHYTSTQHYTASCGVGTIANGPPVTKSATAESFISQADADAKALAAAMAAANDALDCTGSNNGQAIIIRDNASATPYPSVKYVSGRTGVITAVSVNVKNFSHTSPSDVQMILRSPSGTYVTLMLSCGGPLGANPVTNLTFGFSDSAVGFMPQNAVLTSSTFKPTQYGSSPNLPAPASPAPYETTLAAFIGQFANGAWSLWIQDIFPVSAGTIAGVPAWDLDIVTA